MKILSIYKNKAQHKLELIRAKANSVGLKFDFSFTGPEVDSKGVEWVNVLHTTPKVELKGFEFIGVQRRSGDSFLVHSGTGLAITPNDNCDHCNTKRMRNTVYVVRNIETGEIKHIGSTCIELYLGVSVSGALHQLQFVQELESLPTELSEGSASLAGNVVAVRDVIKRALYSIQGTGWVSRSLERDSGIRSTAGSVQDSFFDSFWPTTNITDEDVQAVIDWSKTLPVESEYEMNVANALSANNVDLTITASFSYICSGVNQYLKSKIVKEDSVHFGEVGARARGVTPTLKFSKCIGEGQFGLRYIHVFRVDGSDLTWFTGKHLDIEVGAEVSLSFTVKEHREYQGQAQTIITRTRVA